MGTGTEITNSVDSVVGPFAAKVINEMIPFLS